MSKRTFVVAVCTRIPEAGVSGTGRAVPVPRTVRRIDPPWAWRRLGEVGDTVAAAARARRYPRAPLKPAARWLSAREREVRAARARGRATPGPARARGGARSGPREAREEDR